MHAIALIVVHLRDRRVDRDLVEVRPAEPTAADVAASFRSTDHSILSAAVSDTTRFSPSTAIPEGPR
jgi:hypothetical protein